MNTQTPDHPPLTFPIDDLCLDRWEYCSTTQFPVVKWRRRGSTIVAPFPIRSGADVDAAIRRVLADPWMTGETLVSLELRHDYHLIVSGMRRRIVVLYIADREHLDPYTYAHLKRRLKEFPPLEARPAH